jgi:hypothetical protein
MKITPGKDPRGPNTDQSTLPTHPDNTQGSLKIDLPTSSKYGKKTENT